MANQYKDWSEDQIRAVWNKGRVIPGLDSNKLRQDLAGAWIEYSQYGNHDNDLGFGWEIDHRVPKSRNGTDDISNLRPLQWENNRSKGDNYPIWSSTISSDGDKNIRKTQSWSLEQ